MIFQVTTAITAYQTYVVDAKDVEHAKENWQKSVDGDYASCYSAGYNDDEFILDVKEVK